MACPTLAQFLLEVKRETRWLLLGVYMGVPKNDLEDIDVRLGPQGAERCLAEVYDVYRQHHGPPPWPVIAGALSSLGNRCLEHEIRRRYLCGVTATDNDSAYMDLEDDDELRVFVDDEVMKEFGKIRRKYSALHLSVKKALATHNVAIGDIQSIVEDHTGLSPLSLESATLDNVYQRIKQHVSCLSITLLTDLVDLLLSHTHVPMEVAEYSSRLEGFKSSTLMKSIVEDVRERRRAVSGGKIVSLKVSQAWEEVTISEFERLVNVVFHSERMSSIRVYRGSLLITWLAEGRDDVIQDFASQNTDFMNTVGILSLIVGGQVIYQCEDESTAPTTFEAAMLNIFEIFLNDDTSYTMVGNNRPKDFCVDAVELLLSVGCNPYQLLPSGDTVLDSAISMRDSLGYTVLDRAQQYGHHDIALLVVGTTPLMLACSHGDSSSVALLLRDSVGINVQDSYGLTALHYASRGGHAHMVSTLIEAGARLNVVDNKGSTPLLAALQGCHGDVTSALLDAGADVSIADDGGMTPLMAAANSSIMVAEIASLSGETVNAQDHDKRTALHCSCLSADSNNADIAALISAGADVNMPDIDGTTPLMIASETGNKAVLDLMLLPSAALDIRDELGHTALYHATVNNHASIVTMLLWHGASPDVPDKYDDTPLLRASFLGHKDIVKTLLLHNANVNYCSRFSSETAVKLASLAGHSEVVQVLVRWGATVGGVTATGERSEMEAFSDSEEEYPQDDVIMATVGPRPIYQPLIPPWPKDSSPSLDSITAQCPSDSYMEDIADVRSYASSRIDCYTSGRDSSFSARLSRYSSNTRLSQILLSY